ncbi:semaphorin-6B-like protein [Lates japonicus]|uniref:Semaphorin-6B-like protein n=1 Tax=Lates japonicus TaxID=270547 RepID=A0AAD3RHU1_LATJO|nr:semaphorin-6B-like protein [Lates japonicus]
MVDETAPLLGHRPWVVKRHGAARQFVSLFDRISHTLLLAFPPAWSESPRLMPPAPRCMKSCLAQGSLPWLDQRQHLLLPGDQAQGILQQSLLIEPESPRLLLTCSWAPGSLMLHHRGGAPRPVCWDHGPQARQPPPAKTHPVPLSAARDRGLLSNGGGMGGPC